MSELLQIVIGLAFLGVILLTLCGYAAWNIKIRKIPMRRAADEDAKMVDKGEMTKEDLVKKIQSLVGPLLTASAALSAITIAAVFIIIALALSGGLEVTGVRLAIIFVVLALASASAICWLLSMEQLTQMMAPSVDYDRLLAFQGYTYNLWVIGMTLLLLALYLFLLLAHFAAAMFAGITAACILIGYWKIHCKW